MTALACPVCAFQNPHDYTRDVTPPMTRDDAANRELIAMLLMNGWRYGEPVWNYPPTADERALLDASSPLYPIDISFLERGDVLVSTTRPALNDHEHGDRKRLDLAYTDLERRIFDAWNPYIAISARSHVRLTPEMASLLVRGCENRRDITFKQTHGSAYKELSDGWTSTPPPSKMLTAAYVLRLDELPGGGPGLICGFGLDAIMTLAWSYRLARDFKYLLDRPGFAMVEIELTPIPERPANLRWAFDFKIRPLIDVRF